MLLWKIISFRLCVLLFISNKCISIIVHTNPPLTSFVRVSSMQAQVLKLQSESQSLRNELASVRHSSERPRTPNGTSSETISISNSKQPPLSNTASRQRREKMSETESRIMEVEMRLKRQLSISELGNLAKMAETELINSKLTTKIGELESSLRSATDACAHADEERVRMEGKMGDSELIIKQMSSKMHDLEDRLHDAKSYGGGGGGGGVSDRELEDEREKTKKHEERVRELESLLGKREEEEKQSRAKVGTLEAKLHELEDSLKAAKSSEDKLAKEKQAVEQKISINHLSTSNI